MRKQQNMVYLVQGRGEGEGGGGHFPYILIFLLRVWKAKTTAEELRYRVVFCYKPKEI